MVALPMAQLVCSAHADELPTEEEMNNLAEWLNAQSSDQLASYVLDVIKNVFLPGISLESQDAFFSLAHKKESFKNDAARLEAYSSVYASIFQKWGITINTAPNWRPFLVSVAKKYGASFNSAVVDGHKDALG